MATLTDVLSVMRNVLVFLLRRSPTFSVPSSLAQFLRTLFSALTPVLSTMTMLLLQKTPGVPIPSSTFITPRFPACQQTTPATSSSSLVMLAVSCHPFPSSTPPKLCSTSFLVTLPRWLELRMVSRNHKQPFRLALPSLSWLYTQCVMLRCWPTRLSTTKLMPGC
jgi:hypothetical protein